VREGVEGIIKIDENKEKEKSEKNVCSDDNHDKEV